MTTIMITGASKGLGRALTYAFARDGINLAICARGEEELTKVRNYAEELGAIVLAVQADITEPRDVESFVSLTERAFGKIDVLINNASILGPSPMPYLLDYPEDEFMEVLKANTFSTFLVTKRVLPNMIQHNKGSIVNITSEAGHTGYEGWGVYGISKFAVEGMTETWADELKGTNIRVNMVDPGEMNTGMHALAVPDCQYPLAEPHEVVDIFLFLASDRSSHLTGRRFEAQKFGEGGDL